MFLDGWSILLDVSRVIVEGAITLSGIKMVRIFDHFAIETVEGFVRDNIFDNDKAISMEATNCNLHVLGRESGLLDLSL